MSSGRCWTITVSDSVIASSSRIMSGMRIAANLRLECVAEGIETSSQLQFLREHGCALGQGYHFSRPLVAEQFVDWMERR